MSNVVKFRKSEASKSRVAAMASAEIIRLNKAAEAEREQRRRQQAIDNLKWEMRKMHRVFGGSAENMILFAASAIKEECRLKQRIRGE